MVVERFDIKSYHTLICFVHTKKRLFKTSFWMMLAWKDSFRTFEWEKAIPCPEVAIPQIKHLLNKV